VAQADRWEHLVQAEITAIKKTMARFKSFLSDRNIMFDTVHVATKKMPIKWNLGWCG